MSKPIPLKPILQVPIIIEEPVEMEHEQAKSIAIPTDTSIEPNKSESSRILSGFRFKSFPSRNQFKLARLLPTLIVIQACILILFCVNFVCFFLSLKEVTGQEDHVHRLELIQNRYSEESVVKPPKNLPKESQNQKEILQQLTQIKKQKSKFLSLVLITLVSFPFHIFGMVAVTKRSFTLTFTYSIIIFILLCLQLRSNLSLEAGHYLTLWFVQFVLFALIALFVVRLYCEKIRKIEFV